MSDLNYKITDQRQTSRLKGSGGFEDVMEIFFTALPSNVSLSEMIPTGLYSKEYVDQVLTQRAAIANDVAGL